MLARYHLADSGTIKDCIMAYTSGTATDYKNLMALLATFASSNGWTILEQTTARLYMRGAGLSGLDEIYCGIECVEQSGSYYNWSLVGSWAWKSGRAIDAHPRTSGKKYAYLWNSSIPYWFVVTPRRIIVIAKISTTYQHIHLGLLNLVSTESQNPYQLLIGGCGSVSTNTYSSTGGSNSAFWANNLSSGRLSIPGGDWIDLYSASGVACYSLYYEARSLIMRDVSDGYILEEMYICDQNKTTCYGMIDGLYRISGSGNSSENTITVSGVNYLVVQDTYRNTVGDYIAMRLN
jgi:hypothetical protein